MLTNNKIELLKLAEGLTKDILHSWGPPHGYNPNAKIEVCKILTEVHETLVKLSKIEVK